MAKKNHRSPEEARDAILTAAENIIVDVGPAGLRISAVAKMAKMAHPNVIHHFGSREGLLDAVAERVGVRATERITNAIATAVGFAHTELNSQQNRERLISAMQHVLDTSYPGDEGRLAVWLHLSGAESSLRDNMRQIVELSHTLRKTLDPNVNFENTSRLVMLVTLALVGEVVSGDSIKHAMGFTQESDKKKAFTRWMAEFLLNLSDEELNPRLTNTDDTH